MRILLDENLPEGLIEPLRRLGHRLYREVAAGYDFFFTKDREFAARVTTVTQPPPVKVILVALRQQLEPRFVAAFMEAFVRSDWGGSEHLSEWPEQS